MRIAFLTLVVFFCHAVALAQDRVQFGAASSEKQHAVQATKAPEQPGALGQSCRRIGPEGSLTFDLACDPNQQNYLTVKFWGSDTEVATLFLFNGDKRIGKYGDVWPELDLGQGGAAFPGRFYYTTYLLPRPMTAGKKTVRIKLGAVGALAPYAPNPKDREQPLKGLTRGIYRAYSSTDPFFRPPPEEVQGQEPPAKLQPKPADFSDLKKYQQRVDDAIGGFKNWQLYGPKWDAAVAQGNLPALVYGGLRQGANAKEPRTSEQWKDYVALPTTQGNAVVLNVLAVFAQAHQSRWSRFHHDKEMLDRVVRGLDCYCLLQGDNGAFSNKTWVGAPQRKRAHGSPLEGFGTRGLGRALLLVYRDLEQQKVLDQPIQGAGNPASSRRQAWAEMFARHRDFLASPEGRGHAPNQDMAQILSLWLANEAVRVLAPKQAWPREKALAYVHAAVGLGPDTLGGFWVTRKGLALEPWGTLGGGYDGNYGLGCLHEISDFAESVGDKQVTKRFIETMRTAAMFYYPAVDGDGFACLRKEGIISTRITKWPAVTDYGWFFYGAEVLQEPLAVRAFQLALTHGASPSLAPGAHWVDEVKNVVHGMDHLEKVLALPPSAARLPMEAEHPDFAWADEQGATVVVKHRGTRMYLALNWRRGFKNDKRDAQHTQVSNTARVHFTTQVVDRIATLAMESPHGFGKLYLCRYGDYYIGMNLTEDVSYEMPVAPDMKAAVDLISGKSVDLTRPPRILPSSTLVLYLGRS